MFRTGVPKFGPGNRAETMNVTALEHDGDLGLVYIKPNGDYWQIVQNVDGAGVSGTNIIGGGLAYWKNYSSYTVTPTIGNSSAFEVAGVYELVVTQNSFCAIRQGGTRTVIAEAGTYARGTPLIAAASGNAFATGDETLTGNLVANDAAGGVVSLQNPYGEDVYIDLARIITTVVAAGACTVDGGVTSVSGATLSDNLIDGADVRTATGTFDNYNTPDVNGKVRQIWPAGAWFTVSKASGATAGLVGTYLLQVTRIQKSKVYGVALGARDGNGNVSARLKIIPG